MRAVRITDHGVGVCEVDEPEGSHPAREVVGASICGTDVDLAALGAQGFTLGHELAVRVGDTVYAVEPVIRCGSCAQCRSGATQRCTGEHANLGIFSDGGLADLVAVPDYALVALPAGLSAEDACLVEPASVAWHGVRRAAVTPGERVAVVGGGSIGLLTAAWLRAGGHAVDLDARHPHQRAAAEALGAGRCSGHYDVVIDAAGGPTALERCAELAVPGGRLVLLGVYYDRLPLSGATLLMKELTCVPAMAYGAHDGVREVDEAAAFLAGHPEVVAALVTHRFGLSEAPEAFSVAADRKAGAIKVVLSPD